MTQLNIQLLHNNSFKDLTSGTAPTNPGVAVFAGLAGLNNYIQDIVFSNNQYSNSVITAGQQQGVIYFYSATGIVISDNTMIGSWTTSQNTQGPAIAPGRINTPSSGITITGNYIEGFDGAWDADSMRHVEVANNVVKNSGHGFNIGYGTQEYIDIHDNMTYDSTHPIYKSQILFGNSNPKKVSIRNNTYVDDTNPATTTSVMYFTGSL